MMRCILNKFGYPNSLIKEFSHWYLLLRPAQVTIGSMVLVEKNFLSRYSDVSQEGFSELARIVRQIEGVVFDLFAYEKMNYLMLMMTDPEVHYHVIPRYSRNVAFNNETFHDRGWPALPNFGEINSPSDETSLKLLDLLRIKFASC